MVLLKIFIMPLTPITPINDIRLNLCTTDEILRVGTIVRLEAFTDPPKASVTFQSSDNSVIRILPDECNDFEDNGSCLLQVVSAGKVLISCKSDKLRKCLSLMTFEEDYQEESEETKMIQLNTDYLRMSLGESCRIEALTNPRHQPVKWRSENYQIANVEDGGIITGCSKGITSVIATYKDSSAKCIVEVIDLDISTDYIKIGIGQRYRIPIGTYPSTYSIIWTSSDDNIASVDWKGIVKGNQLGQVIVTAVVETDTGIISKAITVEVCRQFEPWTYFDKSRIKDLKIVDKYFEIVKYAAGREFRIVKGTDTMPTLYYIRIDKNPWIYNYEVAAIDDDIQKFLLMQ